jgi:lipopolysaccharide transport system permease protein
MKRQIRYYFDLLTTLTKKEIKVRYRNSILGYLWSIANPLAFAFVFYIAFKVVMKIDVENYTIFLISGLFPWQWFSNSVNASSGIFLGNANLIKKVNFPISTLPLTTLLNDAFHFLVSIPVITLFVILYKIPIKLSWIYGIPILMLIQILFTYGIALAISSINLFFRDMERLVIIFTTLLFYFTPIFYPETMIPQKYQSLINLNPLACLMINWRMLFLKGEFNSEYLFLGFFYALISLLIGYLIFRRLSIRFAEVL